MNEKALIQIRTELDTLAGEDLWNVLSALRGPDDENHHLKVAITCVIRYYFLGGASRPPRNMYGSMVFPDTEEAAELRRKVGRNYTHFICHAKDAFEALGLKWGEVNT